MKKLDLYINEDKNVRTLVYALDTLRNLERVLWDLRSTLTLDEREAKRIEDWANIADNMSQGVEITLGLRER